MPILTVKPTPASADGALFKTSGSFGSYRLAGVTVQNGAASVVVETTRSGANYNWRQYVARFDTSALPPGEIIHTVTFKPYILAYANANALQVLAEWYEGPAPIDTQSWSTFPIGNAFTAVAGSLTPGGYDNWVLSNASYWNIRRSTGAYTNGTNLAASKSYTPTVTNGAISGSYPDTGGIELTNGVLPAANLSDAGWVGFQRIDSNIPMIVEHEIDLGTSQVWNSVDLWLCSQSTAGVYWPDRVRIFGSNTAGGPWTELTYQAVIGTDAASGTTAKSFVFRFENTTAYRYVKTELSHTQSFLFLGEVRVFNATQAAASVYEARLRLTVENPVASPSGANGPTIYTAEQPGFEPLLEISYGDTTPPANGGTRYFGMGRSRFGRLGAASSL